MTDPIFTVTDRRGVSRTASGLVVGGADMEMRRLRQAGYTLPQSPTLARAEAARVISTVRTPGSLDASTRQVASEMRRSRMRTAATQRTGANMTIALPKQRMPGASLEDKNIPWNSADPNHLRDSRLWSRMFYATHHLVPLLIDLYARFPVVGLEFQSDDPLIENFYSELFLNQLGYEEWLPESFGREYFIAGEVTSLAHFNEELGTWSSEEILNPDMVRVSKSLFVEEERVQLLVKEMVESLRQGPQAIIDMHESPSERLERTHEYQILVQNYPEIVRAAAQDDGLDISEALWSRVVNRVSPWDLRGTPFLVRSFRTLMLEESLNCAQDSVADRLYSPLILATLGIQDMGDGEPWIPDAGELDDLREDFQAALAADFKLLVHHFGLQVQPVFGREAVPRFDQDYDRIDMQLMQAWGIGQALIMGGTAAAGTYASSALNREVCELLMKGFQRRVTTHLNKRIKIIAEAQEHYAYEKKGGIRRPLYDEVVEEDPETGEKRIVRQPKLLIPEIKFRALNLRDEATERQFVTQLVQMGLPISSKSLAINLPIDFEQEIQRKAEETVAQNIAEAQTMAKTQQICDEQGLPYPNWLAQSLNATLMLRQQKAQTEMLEGQVEIQDQQASQMSAAGQLGLLPGTTSMMPGMGPAGGEEQEDPTQAPIDPNMPGGQPLVEPPRNRARPEISDEMRSDMPRVARRDGDEIRRLSKFEKGPSSYGASRRVSEERVEEAVRRRELVARHPVPRVSDLIEDPDFWSLLHATQHQPIIAADWPEILAGAHDGQAQESRRLLDDLMEQYTDATGISPVWD